MSLRARSLYVCLFVCLAVACNRSEPTPSATAPPPTQTKPVAAPVPPPFCALATKDCPAGVGQCVVAPITTAQATIPTKVCTGPFGEGGNPTQQFVDTYSWNLFLALNWPASTANCAADTSKSIVHVRSGDGTYVVWQTWMPSEKVFVNPGTQTPAAWCSGNGLAAGAQRIFVHDAKATPMAKTLGGKFLQIAEPGGNVLQAAGGVLTDQSQRWVRYERIMNQTEYNYIVNQAKIWNAPQLQALKNSGGKIVIPAGSVEVKSAWKVLTPSEMSGGRYFTTQAIVCNTPDGQRTPCDDKPVTLGLVGLHLVQQVNDGGTMFWSTFEQVDNDTVFFNPNSRDPVNKDLAKQPYVELDASCKGINTPTQAKRVNPIAADPALNHYYQQLLAGSVFANYRLVSTQWTTGTDLNGTPSNVLNLMLETYVQTPPASGPTGCFMCHSQSVTVIPGQDGNHSFFFLEAQYATMNPPR